MDHIWAHLPADHQDAAVAQGHMLVETRIFAIFTDMQSRNIATLLEDRINEAPPHLRVLIIASHISRTVRFLFVLTCKTASSTLANTQT